MMILTLNSVGMKVHSFSVHFTVFQCRRDEFSTILYIFAVSILVRPILKSVFGLCFPSFNLIYKQQGEVGPHQNFRTFPQLPLGPGLMQKKSEKERSDLFSINLFTLG